MSEARDEFCRAIDAGNVMVAKATLAGVVSADESMYTDTDPNFGNATKHLVDWLMQCRCIENVEFSSGIMKSLPPLKMLTLSTKPPGPARIFHLKLRLGPHMEVHSFEG
ncbi:hypothetical protein HAP48_0000480 (plasmid) [Bradyrhizobium septentrionale]|uniref:Uncharacterized protein n=1 Tax=Bradyrhizobium septentrionale TaxID=1404411 RepID=A0A974A6J1_9BRAD|nr:hypothetical protein [Bradyrhizobium septentrionale]UGY11955.1 hypothetical protein HAP48_0000480 [Bradyrhizobium septentrionale]UGY30156.1 hypothetical protein HU675_0047865 [Bradyrhizobium septentrionale]